MKYSFIIPIYNEDELLIKKCINSIVNQKINYEIIMINDGSSNKNTEIVCKKLQSKYKNIKYVYQNNSGSATARNNGLKLVTGNYIVFIDADDEIQSCFFEKIKKFSLTDINVFDYEFIYDKSNESKKCSLKEHENLINRKDEIYSNIMFYPGKLDNFMFGSIWGKIFATDFIKKNGIKFNDNLRKSQDRLFMLNCIYMADNINYYSIQMYKYKMNNKSITHKFNMKMVDYYKLLYVEIEKFCKERNINNDDSKFLSYNIINELLPLTIFNCDYKKKYSSIKKELKKSMNEFNFNEKLLNIHLKDVPTKKGKIKLLYYKLHFYYFLLKYFQNLQKNDMRKM